MKSVHGIPTFLSANSKKERKEMEYLKITNGFLAYDDKTLSRIFRAGDSICVGLML